MLKEAYTFHLYTNILLCGRTIKGTPVGAATEHLRKDDAGKAVISCTEGALDESFFIQNLANRAESR